MWSSSYQGLWHHITPNSLIAVQWERRSLVENPQDFCIKTENQKPGTSCCVTNSSSFQDLEDFSLPGVFQSDVGKRNWSCVQSLHIIGWRLHRGGGGHWSSAVSWHELWRLSLTIVSRLSHMNNTAGDSSTRHVHTFFILRSLYSFFNFNFFNMSPHWWWILQRISSCVITSDHSDIVRFIYLGADEKNSREYQQLLTRTFAFSHAENVRRFSTCLKAALYVRGCGQRKVVWTQIASVSVWILHKVCCLLFKASWICRHVCATCLKDLSRSQMHRLP